MLSTACILETERVNYTLPITHAVMLTSKLFLQISRLQIVRVSISKSAPSRRKGSYMSF